MASSLHRSHRFDFFDAALWAGAATLLALPVVQKMTRRWRARRPTATQEPAIDKTLKDSYPASDPPASRYFDIPVNRR
jgi:hypothetical protein